MGFKGDLNSINLADIFQNLSLNQQTGVLKVTDGESAKSIYFSEGSVSLASSGPRLTTLARIKMSSTSAFAYSTKTSK